MITALELTAQAHITYRQLDYWTRNGHIQAIDRPHDRPGHNRHYSDPEAAVTVRMARLVHAGVSVPVAAAIARGDTNTTAHLTAALEAATTGKAG